MRRGISMCGWHTPRTAGCASHGWRKGVRRRPWRRRARRRARPRARRGARAWYCTTCRQGHGCSCGRGATATCTSRTPSPSRSRSPPWPHVDTCPFTTHLAAPQPAAHASCEPTPPRASALGAGLLSHAREEESSRSGVSHVAAAPPPRRVAAPPPRLVIRLACRPPSLSPRRADLAAFDHRPSCAAAACRLPRDAPCR